MNTTKCVKYIYISVPSYIHVYRYTVVYNYTRVYITISI